MLYRGIHASAAVIIFAIKIEVVSLTSLCDKISFQDIT